MIAGFRIVPIIFLILAVNVPAWSASAEDLKRNDASGNFTLEIFGNANMDNVIDEKDAVFVDGIIKGANSPTNLSDANYDGKIDQFDIVQIELIIKGAEKNLTIMDSKGDIVTIKKPLKRVVALSDDAVEILRSIEADASLVGAESRVMDNREFFGALSDLPTVGKWNDPDVEAILKLDPDAVICYMEYPSKEKLEDKIPSTIPILRFECDDPDKIDREVSTLGYIFDRRNESLQLMDFYDQAVSQVSRKVSGLKDADKPTVFMEWSTEKYKSFSKGMSFDIVCTMAGGKNIVADLGGKYNTKYPTLDEEWVTKQNPQFFIHMSAKTDGGYASEDPAKMAATYNEIMNRTALTNVAAIEDRNVYVLSAWEILDTPRFFVGLGYMAKILHPDLFRELDPKMLHEEYLQRFQKIPYQGVYIYPQDISGR